MPGTLAPYLRLRNAERAIEFYARAFGAEELMRLRDPSGRIGHAELRIGESVVMLADEFPEYGVVGPESLGGTTVSLSLVVDDADATIRRAEAAGATVLRPPKDEFYGERTGKLRDPFGHEWHISHVIETLTADEMQRRYDALGA
jgi:uncharacterized glyoxalase superfamily protein PhnB